MPKIKTYRFKFKGDEIEIPFYYTSGKGFFAKGIPDELRTVTNEFYEANESEDDLYRKLRRGFQKYHKLMESTRKVIGYRVHLSRDLRMVKTGEGSWSGDQPWVPKSFRGTGSFHDGIQAEGTGFVIDWNIWKEVSGEEVKYHRILDDGTLGHGRTTVAKDYEILGWTADREKAFQDIDHALEEMVKKLAAVLGKPDLLIKAIDAGLKLLPEEPEKVQ